MKKILVIVFGTLFFLILIGLAVYKLFSPANTPAPSTTTQNPFGNIPVTAVSNEQDPALFSHDFYAWYISNIAADPNFPSAEQVQQLFPAWLTETFVSSWKIRGDALYADPVLFAQDSPVFWGGGVTAKTINQSSTVALVSVVVGDTNNLHTYKVHLSHLQNGWRIDSIEGTF